MIFGKNILGSKVLVKRAYFVFLPLVIFISLRCQDINLYRPSWEYLGLDTVPVTRIKMAGSYLYACGGPKGLYRKNVRTQSDWEYLGFNDYQANSGDSWYAGVTDFDAKANDILISYQGYLLSTTIGVWRSTDGGAIFMQSDSGIATGPGDVSYTNSVGRSNVDPSIGIAINSGLVYRTTTSGTEWSFVIEIQPGISMFETVLWHPYNPKAVWVYGSELLSTSQDAGRTWKAYNLNSLGISEGCIIFDMAFDAFDTNIVYIAACPTLMKSTDNGNSWTFPLGRNSELFQTVATHPTVHNLAYVSAGPMVFRSVDGLVSKQSALGTPNHTVISSMTIDGVSGVLYVATVHGIYRYVGL